MPSDDPTQRKPDIALAKSALRLHRSDIRRVVEQNGAINPRVFGSVIHGEDTETSDLDLLVDPIDGRTTLTSLVRIKREIELLTGVTTDVLTPMALPVPQSMQ